VKPSRLAQSGLSKCRLAGERHKLRFLATELGSGGRRLPGRGRRAERRVALCRRRLNVVVVVVVVVVDVAVARPADKPSPCESEFVESFSRMLGLVDGWS